MNERTRQEQIEHYQRRIAETQESLAFMQANTDVALFQRTIESCEIQREIDDYQIVLDDLKKSAAG